MKLSHGEYVQLSRIEDVLRRSDMIDFVCVVPSENKDYLIAILCLNKENVLKFSKSHNFSPSSNNVDELISKDSFKQIFELELKYLIGNGMILSNLDGNINKFEIPKSFILTTDMWSPEEGLLTPSMKIKRINIVKRYKEQIDKLK